MDEFGGTGVTSVDTPRARSIGSADQTTATVTVWPLGAGQTTTQVPVSTPREAMHLQEIHRMRAFLIFVVCIATMNCFIVPMMGGNPLATWIHVAATAVAAIVAVIVRIVIHDDDRYGPWMTTVLGLFTTTAVATGFYFWGVNSGVVLIVPIGVYFFALGESFLGAITIQVYATVSHAAISALRISGAIEDVGLVRTFEVSRAQQIGMLLALQVIFLASFIMARGLRKASLDTLEQLDRAVRDSARREALLNEAKQDLAWALRIGGPGRYTEKIVGSFRLGNVIGRGAMGEVYEAVHTETSERAAVKLLAREALRRPDMVSRFLRELNIAASLDVENVVRVLAVPDPLDPLPYLVMERLEGETLADQLRRESKMRPSEATRLMRALSRGIGAAHKAGIVHRDLKPRNVFRHESNHKHTWKILDFGVSKLMDQTGTLTQGNIIGTPAYMAPEQARGEQLDARADLYALGVIGYRVLTGRPAFSGKDIPGILRSVVYDTPPKPSEVGSVDPAFDCVLAIAMAKAPEDRFADATELWQAFKAAGKGALSPELKARGAQLMEKHPWGERDVA